MEMAPIKILGWTTLSHRLTFEVLKDSFSLFVFSVGEQRKVAKAIDKAEKYEMSVDPFEVMKRKTSAKESYSKPTLEEFDTDWRKVP